MCQKKERGEQCVCFCLLNAEDLAEGEAAEISLPVFVCVCVCVYVRVCMSL